MAREGMSGDYRDFVDSLMDKVASDGSRILTDVFKVCIAQELQPASTVKSS